MKIEIYARKFDSWLLSTPRVCVCVAGCAFAIRCTRSVVRVCVCVFSRCPLFCLCVGTMSQYSLLQYSIHKFQTDREQIARRLLCARCLLNSFPFMALSRTHSLHSSLAPASPIKSIQPIKICCLLCALCTLIWFTLFNLVDVFLLSFLSRHSRLQPPTTFAHFGLNYFFLYRRRTWFGMAFWTHFIVWLTFGKGETDE